MKLSVVIPCYNSADTLGVQLEALCAQTWSGPWDVIVADNGSTDHPDRVVDRYRPRLNVEIIDASTHRGASHARNVGAEAAKGDTLLFCDADDEVAAGWLAAMAAALVDHAFVACRYDIRRLNAPWLLGSRGHAQAHGLGRIAYPPFTLYAAGGSLGVRRSIHDMVGGFDVSMRYLEDTDYCLRIQCRGIPLQFVPAAVVHYRFPTQLGAIYRQSFRWAQYNVLLYKRNCQTHWADWPLWRGYLRAWVRVARVAKAVARRPSNARAAVLAERLGTQMGALKGAALYRIPPVTL